MGDERSDRLLLLSEMSLRCNLAAEEREVYQVVAAYVPRVMGAHYVGVTRCVEGAEGEAELEMLGVDAGALPASERVPTAGTEFANAVRENRASICNAVASYPPPCLATALGIRSIVHAPIHEGLRPVGTLHVSSREPGAFGPTDAALLTQIAALVTSALARLRAHAEMLRARAAAEEASRAKSEYLAHLSHEIRTPLNGVIGTISLLQQTPLNAEQVEYTNTIRASGEALLSIVNEVLDFSKIEAQQVELEERAFEVRGVVRDAINIVSAQARQRGLDLRVEVDPAAPRYCRGDPFRVQQILVNLLSNAVKFTRQGHVRVTVAAAPAQGPGAPLALRFRVEDTGIGIPPDRLDRLFRPFSQADRSTARRFGGTGLGLAISRRLCELMGGSIEVETAPGRGTAFTFVVRVGHAEAGESSAPRAPSSLPAAAARAELRVLVAEDNPVNQRVAEMMLRKNGFAVDVVSNGVEALEALERRRYDVVLMDVQMPELDGLEATRRIVERWGDARPRVIAMTANALRGDRELCLAAGMDDYVDKPARATDLVSAIARVLSPRG